MGWDYYTFESQPPWFLEEISLIMYHENRIESERLKAMNRKSPSTRR